ncbi:uncharacterized protein MELLADRAFT_116342 [Melampsora larici-populina 98AG31]|uniref:Uncharacterized protein n=1 Tax=Melampsora larici-populina (strain 98AG31 / pathotype 3-4-7) TaxID=747676 RepID=F4RK82_MELLP|nr:uncharacterized protein MELLADRAFT_116342 [Melampsora larici-populina 98AG31]EGG07230.1 hypothetical protein MELLADRAFT_116342 [Melampsora larici-populina 98AG31]
MEPTTTNHHHHHGPSIINLLQRQQELNQLLNRQRARLRQQQLSSFTMDQRTSELNPLNQSSESSPPNPIQTIRNSVSMFGPHARAIEDFTRRRREIRPPSQLRSQDRLSPEPETSAAERSISIYERNARLREEFSQRQEARRNPQSQTSIPSQFLQFLQPTSSTSQTQSEEETPSINHRPISPPIHLPPTPPTNRVNLNQRPSSTSQGPYLFNGHFQDPQNNLMSVNLNDLSRPSSVSDSSDDSNQQTTETSDLLNDSESDQNAALFFTSLQNGHQSRIRRGRDTSSIDNVDLGNDPDPLLVEAAAHHNSMTIAEALGLPTPYDDLPERQAHDESSRFSRRASNLTGLIMDSNPITTDRLDNTVEQPSDVSMSLFESFDRPEPNPSTENQDVLPRRSTTQTTNLVSNPQSRSSGESNERPNQITQLSNNRRRRLLINNETTDWRHALVEQMHNDFDAGLDRTMAVNRLRQLTMNHHHPSVQNQNHQNPPTSLSAEPVRRNLVGTLRNIRSQRQANNNLNRGIHQGSNPTSLSDPISRSSIQVYLVYCGAPQADRSIFSRPQTLPKGFQLANPSTSSSSRTRSSSLSRGITQGCGKLITIRSINPSHAARKPIPNGMFKTPIENVLSSDSYPISQSVGIVDHESRLEFENDPSNPCIKDDESDQQDRFVCYCTKEYIGCLSCGHIVGHWVKVHCFYCERWSSTQHRFFYYLKRITYIPRYEKGMIANFIPTNRTFSFYSQQRQQGHHNKKAQLLQAKQMVYEKDLRDGYIGSEEDWKDRSQDENENENGNRNEEGGLLDDIMGYSTANTMTQRMRSSILDSSLVDLNDLRASVDFASYQSTQSSPRHRFLGRRLLNTAMISNSMIPTETVSTRTPSRLVGEVRQIHNRRWSALGPEVERNEGSRDLVRSRAIRLSNYRFESSPNLDTNLQQADAEEEEDREGEMVPGLNPTSLNTTSNTTRRSSRVSNSPITNPSLNPRADSLDLDGIPIRDSRPRLNRMIRSSSISLETSQSREERLEENELNELIDMGEVRSNRNVEEAEDDERSRIVRIDSIQNGRRRRGGNEEEVEEDESLRSRSSRRRRIHGLDLEQDFLVGEQENDDHHHLGSLFGNFEVCAR